MKDSSTRIKKLTGAHTRVVWAQQQSGYGDFVVATQDFRLMGIDTDDGKGIRCVCDTIDSYACPIITPNGERVIYTSNKDYTVNIVNWDGSGKKILCPGYGVAVWKDPGTGDEWVYVRPNKTKSWFSKSRPVIRHLIDNPSVCEEVWNKSSVSWNWFQPSPDGTRAAYSAPWPRCGMAMIPNGKMTEFDRGCWTSMAPDNSYRMWVFDGNHREVKLYDQTGKKLAVIDVHEGPGINGWEIYHPRWSNNVRFMTVTGPYSGNNPNPHPPEEHENLIPSGGSNVELYIGRLDPSITRIEKWVRITENDKADFLGDAWIKPD